MSISLFSNCLTIINPVKIWETAPFLPYEPPMMTVQAWISTWMAASKEDPHPDVNELACARPECFKRFQAYRTKVNSGGEFQWIFDSLTPHPVLQPLLMLSTWSGCTWARTYGILSSPTPFRGRARTASPSRQLGDGGKYGNFWKTIKCSYWSYATENCYKTKCTHKFHKNYYTWNVIRLKLS